MRSVLFLARPGRRNSRTAFSAVYHKISRYCNTAKQRQEGYHLGDTENNRLAVSYKDGMAGSVSV